MRAKVHLIEIDIMQKPYKQKLEINNYENKTFLTRCN